MTQGLLPAPGPAVPGVPARPQDVGGCRPTAAPCRRRGPGSGGAVLGGPARWGGAVPSRTELLASGHRAQVTGVAGDRAGRCCPLGGGVGRHGADPGASRSLPVVSQRSPLAPRCPSRSESSVLASLGASPRGRSCFSVPRRSEVPVRSSRGRCGRGWSPPSPGRRQRSAGSLHRIRSKSAPS